MKKLFITLCLLCLPFSSFADSGFIVSAGTGDVSGPLSSSNNEIVRFDGTTGKLIKDSGVVSLSDVGTFSRSSGNMSLETLLGGNLVLNAFGLVDVNSEIEVTKTSINTNLDEAADIDLSIQNTIGSTNVYSALSAKASLQSNTNITGATGGIFISENAGTASISNAIGVSSQVNNLSTGPIANAVGASISSDKLGAGIITNFIGVDLISNGPTNNSAFRFNSPLVSNARALKVIEGSSNRFFPISRADTGLTFDSNNLTLATTTSGNVNLTPAGVVNLLGRMIAAYTSVNSSNIAYTFDNNVNNTAISPFGAGTASITTSLNSSFSVPSLTPLFVKASNNGAGLITIVRGINDTIANADGGIITDAFGLSLSSTNSGGGTLTNYSGIEFGSSAATNNYAFNMSSGFLSNSRSIKTVLGGNQRFIPYSLVDTGLTFQNDLVLASTLGALILNPFTFLDINGKIDQDFSRTDNVDPGAGFSENNTHNTSILTGVPTTSNYVGYSFDESVSGIHPYQEITGIKSSASYVGSNTIQKSVGLLSLVNQNGTGTTSKGVGLKVEPKVTSGTMSSFVGVEMEALPTTPTNVHAFEFDDNYLENQAIAYLDDAENKRFIPTAASSANAQRKKLFFPAETSSNLGAFRVRDVGTTANFNFNFSIPSDCVAVTSAQLIGIVSAGAAQINRDIDLTSEYGAIGEISNTHSQTNTTTLYDLSTYSGKFYPLNLLPVLTSLTGGDFAGVTVQHNVIGGAIDYIGVRIECEVD